MGEGRVSLCVCMYVCVSVCEIFPVGFIVFIFWVLALIFTPTHIYTHTAHVLYWNSRALANFILKETRQRNEEEEQEGEDTQTHTHTHIHTDTDTRQKEKGEEKGGGKVSV